MRNSQTLSDAFLRPLLAPTPPPWHVPELFPRTPAIDIAMEEDRELLSEEASFVCLREDAFGSLQTQQWRMRLLIFINTIK